MLRENCCVGSPAPSRLLLALDHQPRLAGRQRHAGARIAELADGFGLAESGTDRAGLDGGDLGPRPARRRRAVHQLALPDAYRRRRRAARPTPGSPPCTSAISASATSTASRSTSCAIRSACVRRGICAGHRGRRPLLRRAGRLWRIRAGRHRRSQAWFASDGTRQPAAGRARRPARRPLRPVQARRDGAPRRPFRPAAASRLAPGETLVSICCGGGGYGAPQERDPRARPRTTWPKAGSPRTRAEAVYGVVVDERGTLDVALVGWQRAAPGPVGAVQA